jgi:alpha-tubulin suppressor-like RCC1 family protein
MDPGAICSGFGYFTVFALKPDGTLWSWGREADFYTGATDPNAIRTPAQVGTATDWQACSSAGGLYHLLRKRDGTLWALDASEHRTGKPDAQYHPIKLQKLEFSKKLAAFAAGGDNMSVMLTPEGEVWTWGTVIGEHSPQDYFGPKGQVFQPKTKVMADPWQVSNEE